MSQKIQHEAFDGFDRDPGFRAAVTAYFRIAGVISSGVVVMNSLKPNQCIGCTVIEVDDSQQKVTVEDLGSAVRRSGVGRTMMAIVKEIACSLGAKYRIVLVPLESAIPFYHRFGFRPGYACGEDDADRHEDYMKHCNPCETGAATGGKRRRTLSRRRARGASSNKRRRS